MSAPPPSDRRAPSAGGPARVWAFLREAVRSRETGLVLLAALAGVIAGLAVTLMSRVTGLLHEWLFALAPGERLSGSGALGSPWMVLVPAAGGLIMGTLALVLKRLRPGPFIDPIEANALHGGRMSLTDSIIVAAQTMISNGFGASLGLEAGFTQIGGGIASRVGAFFGLRRNDLRILVGAGAGGAIGAAFGAPLMGAFYGFELIIGVYAIPAAAPVLAATLSAMLTARALGVSIDPLPAITAPVVEPADFFVFVGLGLVAALAAVVIMRLVTGVETLFARSRLPPPARAALAGACVGGLALYSPEVLSDGHGALHLQVASPVTAAVAIVFALKVVASALSLGSGFRGGLFFASLFLGALLGKLYAAALSALLPALAVDPALAAVVGMGALAVGVVGGPFTMSFLVLEMTRDLGITAVVIAAAATASLTVRETFGYSFSTWRFHLRGETIRSAQDVGWMRALTVERMMRADPPTFSAGGSLSAFCATFPLDPGRWVVLVDGLGRYGGLVEAAEAHAALQHGDGPVAALARHPGTVLTPGMTVKQAADAFVAAGAEDLAVVDGAGEGRVLGLLNEADALRRYAQELEQARRGLVGDA